MISHFPLIFHGRRLIGSERKRRPPLRPAGIVCQWRSERRKWDFSQSRGFKPVLSRLQLTQSTSDPWWPEVVLHHDGSGSKEHLLKAWNAVNTSDQNVSKHLIDCAHPHVCRNSDQLLARSSPAIIKNLAAMLGHERSHESRRNWNCRPSLMML